MRILFLAVAAACAAIVPAGSAAADLGGGGFPIGCETPHASCPGTKPQGQQICVYYNGGSFCFDIWP